jgi:hypothetical protein
MIVMKPKVTEESRYYDIAESATYCGILVTRLLLGNNLHIHQNHLAISRHHKNAHLHFYYEL